MAKKRQIVAFCLVMLVSILMVGCSGENYTINEAGQWKDGTYTKTAKGKNASFDVTVVIDNGYIQTITIGDNKETPEKGGVAINELPAEMVTQQSYEVDAISGATVTSNGIKDAVARCLQDASE